VIGDPSRPGETAELAALLAGPLRVINVGLEAFAEEFAAAGVLAAAVDWRPPAGGDVRLAALLAALEEDDDDTLDTGTSGPPAGGR
jgi:hypothetical protein